MRADRIGNLFLLLFLIALALYLIYFPGEEQQNWLYDCSFFALFLTLFGVQKWIIDQQERKSPVQKIRIIYHRGMVEWTMIILGLIVLVILLIALWKDGYSSILFANCIAITVSITRIPKSVEYRIEKNHLYAPGHRKSFDIQKITFLEINEKANLDVGYEGKTIEFKQWDTDLLRMVRDKLMELNPGIKSSSETE